MQEYIFKFYKKGSDFKQFIQNFYSKSIISPVSFDLKSINGDIKKNLLIHIHFDLKDKKMTKVSNFATKLITSNLYLEMIKSMFDDLSEKFVENIKNFNFSNVMIERMFLKFSHSYQNPHIHDFIFNHGDNYLFIIPRNYKIFHFISKNKVSFILEFFDTNKIKIYSILKSY